MAESISASSNSVSRQVLADIKSAFRSYAENSKKETQTEEEQDKKVYADRGQITRKAYYDMEKAATDVASISEKRNSALAEQREKAIKDQQQEAAKKITNASKQEQAQTKKIEAKQISLSKSTETIVTELRRNGLHRTMTEYQVAKEYGVSYMKAREILEELNKDSNGFVREYKLPENSTVSYKV